ncbi:MAG: NAD-dependent succinate-semialdehyde dehydrogenase, partial [Novosphingobium sp.]|nr:NAD-dependent succinate-semialdehyde dehydrogenase [Novosphingobium sp.]
MTQYPSLHMIIDGERIAGGGRRTHAVINPATGETIGELPLAEAADLDRALETAAKGFRIWRNSTPQQRAAVLQGAARLMSERQEDLARIASMEEGKTLPESRIEVLMNVGLFNFYAGEVFRLYGRTLVRPAGMRSTITHEPVGPVAAFAPWNFPLGNPGRKLGAPIAAGCSVILKAAEETPASALGVLQCLLDAGLPKEVAQAVFGVPDEVSRHMLASPVVRKLSFTGSTVVGKHLARLAADNCIRTTMELGGHGPVLVFADADIERTLDTVVPHKYRNAGQVCVSPTRFIVESSVFERFRDGFVERAKAIRVGNGLDADSQMGPMANARRPEAIDQLVANAVQSGAKLHCGGERVGNAGFFYAPTVLSEIPLDATIMNEEPFGPVALINPYRDEEAMIAEANRLPYGLAAYAWTQ